MKWQLRQAFTVLSAPSDKMTQTRLVDTFDNREDCENAYSRLKYVKTASGYEGKYEGLYIKPVEVEG